MEKVVYSSGCIDLYKKNVHYRSFFIYQDEISYPISILKGVIDTFPNVQKDTPYNNIRFTKRRVLVEIEMRYPGEPMHYPIDIDTPGLKEVLQDLLYFRQQSVKIANKRTSDDLAPELEATLKKKLNKKG